MLQNFVLFISFRKTYIYIFSIIDFYSRDMTVIKERCLEIKCNILVQKLVGQWNEMVTSRRAHTHTHTHIHTHTHCSFVLFKGEYWCQIAGIRFHQYIQIYDVIFLF